MERRLGTPMDDTERLDHITETPKIFGSLIQMLVSLELSANHDGDKLLVNVCL